MDVLCVQVTGRQLPPPELHYTRDRQTFKVVPQPDRGSWDMRDVKFFRSGEIKCFAVAAYCSQHSAGGPAEDPASIQVISTVNIWCTPRHSTAVDTSRLHASPAVKV